MTTPKSTQLRPDHYLSDNSSEAERLSEPEEDGLLDILVGPNTSISTNVDRDPRPAPARTYQLKPLERTDAGSPISPSKELIATHRFYRSVTPASIDRCELERLAPEKWLNTDLVNFYVFEVANSYLEHTPGAGRTVCALPESIWSSSSDNRGNYTPRPRCDKMESALDFDYVAFAGNCSNTHYYLCIIAYASDLLADRNPSRDVQTVCLVLNSLRTIGPTDAPDRFRNVILRLGKKRPIRKDGLKRLKVYYPRVS